jgi:hypothetical protein
MNALLIDNVSGSGSGGFAGVGHIDLGNWFFGGGFAMFAMFVFAAAAKGGF